jgi:hypothetical protein
MERVSKYTIVARVPTLPSSGLVEFGQHLSRFARANPRVRWNWHEADYLSEPDNTLFVLSFKTARGFEIYEEFAWATQMTRERDGVWSSSRTRRTDAGV